MIQPASVKERYGLNSNTRRQGSAVLLRYHKQENE